MPPFIGGMPVPFTLRRSLARDVFQTPLADFLLAHQELLNLLRHRHGEAVHEPDVLRDFEVRDFPLAERLDFFRGGVLAGFELYPRQHGFAQAGVGDADDIDRSEEHTSELQSLRHLVCRLLLEKKTNNQYLTHHPKRHNTTCTKLTTPAAT